jgi:hypothetical protein
VSTKTFCDRCGRQCRGNKRGHVHLVEIHFTSGGEHVGEDEYPPADLCWRCLKVIKEVLGKALAIPRQNRRGELVAMEQPLYTEDARAVERMPG